jgi:leucyl aminopeptidase (aminopeptidase T)
MLTKKRSRVGAEQRKLKMLHKLRKPKGFLNPVHHTEMPRILKKHGSKFVAGARNAINSLNAKKGHVVLVVGDHAHSDLVHAMAHAATKKTSSVLSHIVPKNTKVSKGSDDLNEILSIIRNYRPDIIMLAFHVKDWPGRFKLYEESKRVNPKRLFASMPGITYNAVKEILPADISLMQQKTRALQRFIENNRGEEILIETARKSINYLLKGKVPVSERLKIVADAQSAEPGGFMNIPGGEAFFQPSRLSGGIFLPPKTVIADIGRVVDGVEMLLRNGRLEKINPVTFRDRDIVRKMLVRMRGMNCFKVSELGIGTHPKIDLDIAGKTTLLIERVVNTFHLGFGDSKQGGWGNVVAKDHFDVVVPSGRLTIAGKKIVPRKQ